MRAARRQRDRAVQACVVGVADRRDGGEAVERAAQDDDDQARIASVGGACEFREIGPGGERRAAEQKRAARGCKWRPTIAAIHRHLLWNSGDINNSASACCRDSARSMVRLVSGDAASAATSSSKSRGSTL